MLQKEKPPAILWLSNTREDTGGFSTQSPCRHFSRISLVPKGFSALAVVPNRVLVDRPCATIAANHHQVEDQCFTGTGAYACFL